ncbi:DUF2778 domain-containing protein [Methylovirgula sp. HY1]|uniref:DUF2778 domain-containing protein n=1 Tax=Methylovirgula sp. HY1 TaxID=2822761 RepID=UPI001C74663A|nr:DUF2778 domain-containing protein [Methylovirgula sp. HY1]QXX76382.1 hypothetical protein MHY1_03222 [Methylovirgula sp. HY1]
MTDGIGTPQDFISSDRGRLSPTLFSVAISGAGALVFSALVGALLLYARHTTVPGVDELPATAPAPMAKSAAQTRDLPGVLHAVRAAVAATNIAAETRNRSPNISPEAYGTLAAVPAAIAAIERRIYGALVAMPAPVADDTNVAQTEPPASNAPQDSVEQGALRGTDTEANPPASAAAPEAAGNVPVPPLRPRSGGLLSNNGPLRASPRKMAEEASTPVAEAAPADQRNFFQKMFGIKSSSGQTLAYASPEDGILSGGEERNTSAAVAPYGPETAVYDIAAHTVFMPDGTKLEAHSGLGSELDDPHYVNVKMRGATPPHIYALKPRETLFHGVQALRLIPVGSGGLYGRTGLLAHSYMLGPNGQSNGCVSFKNYKAFLQAYMKGEVKRLVVVAGLN